jgi:hypothetical protein
LCESGLRVIVSDISYVFLIALFEVSTGLSHVNVLACFTRSFVDSTFVVDWGVVGGLWSKYL